MATAPTTVWAVRLGASGDEVEGTLSLQGDDLVFSMDEADLRIALADVRKAKRTRGSPVLTVEHIQEGEIARHAFFFVKPPPLKPIKGKSKRKNARQSILYLQNQNKGSKEVLMEWEKAIRDGNAGGATTA